MSKILKIAHRGASAYAPENTLTAFNKAIELGADMIELDIHLCKTGELIVMHDETVDRTTNGQGKLSNKTLDEIKQLTIDHQEKVPTLLEVINLTKGKCRLDIEIKNKKAAQELVKMLHRNNIENTVMISSSYIKPLRVISKANSKINTALIFYAGKNKITQSLTKSFSLFLFPFTHLFIIRKARKARVQWIHLMKSLAHKNFITLLHKLNYKTAVWTVDKPQQINNMKKRGVDAIISNYPDRL